MLYFKYLIVFLSTGGKIVSTHNLIEKTCTLQPTEEYDIVCKRLCDCTWAEKFIEKNHSFPWTCGFENLHLLVCCPVSKPGLISKRMCQNYASLVYEEVDSSTMLPNSSSSKVSTCAQVKVEQIIIGGKITQKREFPHMVLIGLVKKNSSKVNWVCGGTILSEYYILTAAHCLNDTNNGVATYVKMGITNRNDENFTNHTIAQRIYHPNYTSPIYYHDIALLKLDKPAQLNSYARPACLYTADEIIPQTAIVTGWGITEANSQSDNLLKLELQIFNYTYCNRSYKNYINRKFKDGIRKDIQFCAGPPNWEEKKDACPGDSGGPLQIFHSGDDVKCMYDIIGVVSFGKPCPSSAGVYVKVSAYVEWIENIVWPYLP